jgi:hypothetical protein
VGATAARDVGRRILGPSVAEWLEGHDPQQERRNRYHRVGDQAQLRGRAVLAGEQQAWLGCAQVFAAQVARAGRCGSELIATDER